MPIMWLSNQMRKFYQQQLIKIMLQDVPLQKESSLQKKRISSITQSSESDTDKKSYEEKNSNILLPFCSQRAHLERKIVQNEICIKLINKAVSWLQINSWAKGCDFESCVLSIAYFYAYLANIYISRSKLEPILSACLFLAAKLIRRPSLPLQVILPMATKRLSGSEIIIEQTRLSEILNWDLWLSFQLSGGEISSLTEEQNQKIKFLIEVLLLVNTAPLTNCQTIADIKTGCKLQQLPTSFLQLRPILKKNSSKFLINKYKSQFDVQHYIRLILQ